MSTQSGYAIAIDGSPIFFRLEDPEIANASTLVFCDGIGCDGFVWKYLRQEFSRRYRLVHFHYRGHGRTRAPRDEQHVGIEVFADDLASVLDETDTAKAIVFGHSLGVQVALEGYRRHRDRVSGLVLMCGSPENPLRTFRGTAVLESALPTFSAAVRRAPKLWNRVTRALVPTRLGWNVATRLEVDGSLVDRLDIMEYLNGLSRVDVPFFLSILEGARQHSAIDLLPEINAPTLIIAGERDGFTPRALSDRMHNEIRNSELHTVSGGSHVAPLERPAEVVEVVREFLLRRIPEIPSE